MLLKESDNTKIYSNKYDAISGMDTDCSISVANIGGACTVLNALKHYTYVAFCQRQHKS